MQNTVQYLHHANCRFYVFIYVDGNFYMRKHYYKILKTHDYFQNININVMFLLTIFFSYMQKSVKYLHHARWKFYLLIFVEANF